MLFENYKNATLILSKFKKFTIYHSKTCLVLPKSFLARLYCSWPVGCFARIVYGILKQFVNIQKIIYVTALKCCSSRRIVRSGQLPCKSLRNIVLGNLVAGILSCIVEILLNCLLRRKCGKIKRLLLHDCCRFSIINKNNYKIALIFKWLI